MWAGQVGHLAVAERARQQVLQEYQRKKARTDQGGAARPGQQMEGPVVGSERENPPVKGLSTPNKVGLEESPEGS